MRMAKYLPKPVFGHQNEGHTSRSPGDKNIPFPMFDSNDIQEQGSDTYDDKDN